MNMTRSIRAWAKRSVTARQFASMSQRQLEDIGAFEADNADTMRRYIRGL